MNFTDFPFDQRILDSIQKTGFTECTIIQEKSYGLALDKKDILAQSQTGTGKTAAYLLPVFQRILTEKAKALVITPTRELAVQVNEEIKKLGGNLDLKTAVLYGGVAYEVQEKALKDSWDIVIGTPGRMMDFSKNKKLDFHAFDIVIVDEADRLFDMGFYPDLKYMMSKMKKPDQRQTLLYSATLGTNVRNLAWYYMNQPEEIEIEPENITVQEITQEVYHVTSKDKVSLLLGILKKENPETVLIFTNTKHRATEISRRMGYNGYESFFIMGDLPQKKRLEIIKKIKAGEIKMLIATDVAARGLHIENLPLVINYDIPDDCENYVHRIGRTARAGKSGKAITMACEQFVYNLEAIEKLIGFKIPVVWPEEELFVKDMSPKHIPASELEYQEGGKKSDRGSREKGPRPDNRKPGERQGTKIQGAKPQGPRPQQDSAKKPVGPVQSRPARPTDKSGKPIGTPTAKPFGTAPAKTSGTYGNQNGQRPAAKTAAIPGNNTGLKTAGAHSGKQQYSKPSQIKTSAKPVIKNQQISKTVNNQNVDDRIAYYKQKYGEDFKPGSIKETKKISPVKIILKKLFGKK